MLAGRIVGAETVVSQLMSVSPLVHNRVKDRVSRLAMTLLTKVKQEKLSGQVLHNVTGNLRASINQRVEDMGNAIVGSVGTNIVYARPHEFGIDQHKMVQVHEYLRRNLDLATAKWRLKHKMPVPMVTVHAFTRNQHTVLPERSFLRSALGEMRPQVREELIDALRGSLW